MRIRARKSIKVKTFIICFLFLMPFSYVGYMGIQVGQLYQDFVQFSYDCPPDPATFRSLNNTRMEEMALVYDDLFERNHIPLNFTVDCKYKNDNYTEISRYSYSDNGALWTGLSMAAYVSKYLAGVRENNTQLLNDSLRVVKRLISGMGMLMAVPNGGLGSDYSGILARGWAGPEHKKIAKMYFKENTRHYNGTGIYSNHRWRGYTSNDEFGGFYLGLAMALKFIPDSEVQKTVYLIVDQLCNYMLNTNFLGVNGPGGPTGVNQKPTFGTGGFWIPLLLKMGAICYPEKYQDDYYQLVASDFIYFSNKEGGDQETIANYYAYSFGYCVVLGFLLLEDRDSAIWDVYYQGYLDSMRKFTVNHRNAYFNAAHLVISNKSKTDSTNQIIINDVKDQLARCEINHFPDRGYGTLPVPDNVTEVETMNEWAAEIDKNSYGDLYYMLMPEIRFETTYLTEPLTVEYKSLGIFYWGDNPFTKPSSGSTDKLFEWPGITYTLPYWLLRGFGYI
jgi:hypothetical protein